VRELVLNKVIVGVNTAKDEPLEDKVSRENHLILVQNFSKKY
jgi:hypothetical protein